MVEKKSMMKKTTSKKSDVSEDDKVTKKSSKRTKKDDAELLTEEVEHQYDSQMAEQIVSDAVVIDNTGHTSSSISESDVTIEKKLESLFKLQVIDSKIDEIRIIRGELPLEVQDLEDEIVGLETRIENYESEIELLTADHVLQHYLAFGHFRFAHDGNVWNLLYIGILHLLLHLSTVGHLPSLLPDNYLNIFLYLHEKQYILFDIFLQFRQLCHHPNDK